MQALYNLKFHIHIFLFTANVSSYNLTFEELGLLLINFAVLPCLTATVRKFILAKEFINLYLHNCVLIAVFNDCTNNYSVSVNINYVSCFRNICQGFCQVLCKRSMTTVLQ